jgi:hypothetical protein
MIREVCVTADSRVERDGDSTMPEAGRPCAGCRIYYADYRIAVAQTAPPARNVTPAMKIAVSNLVISQPLRMARLNCLTARWLANN